MRLSDLSANPRNPRKITDQKIEMLKKALAEFGDLSGIVFNRRTNQLVGGHQRLKALPEDAEITLTKLYDEPTRTGTVSEGDISIEGEQFKYREVDWDEQREMAANIAANRGAGDWDFPELTTWMTELDAHNLDMDLTMFDSAERERMLGGWESDIEAVEKTEAHLEGIQAKIVIECPQDLKDEVLIYIKAKLLETSFEGVHVK